MGNEKSEKLSLPAESVFDHLDIWISIADCDFNMIVWNQEAEEESGYPKQAVLRSKKAWRLLYPDKSYRREVKKKLASMLEGTAKQQTTDTTAVTRKNLVKPISWKAVKVIDGRLESLFLIGTGITEKKKALEALEESEQNFRLFSEHLPGAAYIKNREGAFIFFNDYFRKNFGWDTSRLLGKQNKQIWLQDTARELKRNDLEVLSKNRAIVYEEEVEVNGKNRTFISYKFPIPSSKGTLVGGISLDITDRKNMETQLEKSRQRYVETLNLHLDIVFETDGRGQLTYLNRAGKKLLGIEGEGITRRILALDMVAQKDRTKIERGFISIMEARQKQPRLLEFEILGSKGKRIPVIGRIAPIIGAQGEIEGLRGVLMDIGELKQKEKALVESEERYRGLFNNSRDGIYISTLEGEYVDANPALVQMLGYGSRQELISKNILTDIYADKSKRPSYREREKPFEVRLKKKDGKTLWVEISSWVVYREGKPAYYQGIVRDISERKMYERQLRYKSFHDSLTGLYNRAYFEEELKRLDNGRQLPLSVIIGDVNSLKLVNDAFGHKEGDRLLKKSAQILKKACRKEDIIARYGGDEFAILLPKTSAKAADEATERIKEIASKCFQGYVPISISVGVATKSRSTQDIAGVIREAEGNMYRQKLLEKKNISTAVLDSLKKASFKKSHFTREHAARVKQMAIALGKALGLSKNKLDELSLLATFHDIGKIAIDDGILNRQGVLTEDQWKQVNRHPEVGYNIAESTPQLSHIAEAILASHERWDGKGYPQGLAGSDIPISARILSVVEAFDIMHKGCSYKHRLSREEAIAELKKNSGTQFDPRLVEEFIKILENKK